MLYWDEQVEKGRGTGENKSDSSQASVHLQIL